ncbi:zinc-finger double domain-containing protein [Phthorimaea operculella]|nr:zinc-finger double domain-containing protein [Phthorimaea operculella]
MVVCAVKLCRNYTGKNIKPPEGISFHRFPTDDDQKEEWIRAIRREPSWAPGTHCRVCSVHFENSDFKISETGRRILHKDAIPTKNLYREEREDTGSYKRKVLKKTRKLKLSSAACESDVACRACLAVHTDMFEITEQLNNTFAQLTDVQVTATDGCPQHICSVCCTLLLKFARFKTRVDAARQLLQTIHNETSEPCFIHYVYTLCLTPTDGWPQHICSVCCTLLLKFARFKTRVDAARQLLQTIHNETTGQITPETLRTIDRDKHNLTLPFSIKRLPHIDITDIDIKQEKLDFTIEEDSNIDLATVIQNAANANDMTVTDEMSNDDVSNEFDIFDDKNDTLESDLTEQKLFDTDVKIEHNQFVLETEEGKSKVYGSIKKILTLFSHYLSKKDAKEDIRNTKPRKTDEDYENFAKEHDVDIVFLTREEQIAEVEARKESDNYKNSRFKCEECYKGFSSEAAFQNHKAIHDPSVGSYECEACKFRFPKRYKLLHHMTQHKMNFTCKLCGHVSKLASKAMEHFKWHNGVKYPCHYCDRIFIKRTSQFNHMRNRHGSAACDICQEIFSGERGLTAHMQKAHKEAVKSRCESCGVQFHTELALSHHLETLSAGCNSNIKSCAECGDNFNSEDDLNDHMKINHWKEIKCEKCNANFENEKLYRMHRVIHKEVRNRAPRSELATLGKKQPAKNGKKGKMPVIQKRMCEMCGLTWRSAAALRYHQRVHTGEKPHRCPLCPKSFRIQDSLQIHMNTHTGARPFKCPHCPKAFKSRTQNHKHQLVHTKVRRYRCDLCDKTFQTSTCVKTHIRTVHMKIPPPPRARRRLTHTDALPPIHHSPQQLQYMPVKMDHLGMDNRQ